MSSNRKQSRVVHGRNSKRDVSPAGSRSDNPIIVAVERTLQGRRPMIMTAQLQDGTAALIIHGWDSSAPWRPFKFSNETIREVGNIILQALLTGDQRIVETVKDAIKQANHLFNRDREPVLLRQAFVYMATRKDWQTLEELKKGIEKRFNNGKKLDQHRWNRVRKALGLPRNITGRTRKKVRHQTAETVS
jgi:hypothetical protein